VPEPLVNYRSHGGAAHRNVHEMERGMSLFYQKAFATDESTSRLRRRSLGNYHRILAGSYFHAGEYRNFAKNTIKSLWYRPSGIGYFLKFPGRKLQ
jgi:hypothetical protein